MSRKNGCPTRPTPTLRHKGHFAYEYLCPCMHMPLHAVHVSSVIVLHKAPCTKRQVYSQGLASGQHHAASWSQSGHALKRPRLVRSLSLRCASDLLGPPLHVQTAQWSGTPHYLAWPVLARAAHAPPAREGPHTEAPCGAPGASRLTHHGAALGSGRPPVCAPSGVLARGVGRTAYPQSPSTAARRSAASPFVSPARAVIPSLRNSAICFSVAGCWRHGASASTSRRTPRCRA